MITKEQYLRNPCGTASIPFWKAKSIIVPQNMKIVHDSAYSDEADGKDADEPYFRLYHDLQNLTEPALPAGYSVGKADQADFLTHINSCYDGIHITEAELSSYVERTVFNASLWLAIYDDQTGEMVATAIGELDPEIGEGALEWIQVSKGHRGKGLGRYMVLELLRRMKGIADFVTVSGQCNNPFHPEALYRRCGFTGNDVWHVLRPSWQRGSESPVSSAG